MEEIAGWFLAVMAAIAAIFFALWVAVAALARVFAWLLVVWIAAFAAGLVVGILTGVLLPPRVLRGKASEKPEIANQPGAITLSQRAKGHIQFQDVCFSYTAGIPVLEHINLDVPLLPVKLVYR